MVQVSHGGGEQHDVTRRLPILKDQFGFLRLRLRSAMGSRICGEHLVVRRHAISGA